MCVWVSVRVRVCVRVRLWVNVACGKRNEESRFKCTSLWSTLRMGKCVCGESVCVCVCESVCNRESVTERKKRHVYIFGYFPQEIFGMMMWGHFRAHVKQLIDKYRVAANVECEDIEWGKWQYKHIGHR